MADVNANIDVNIDTSNALAQIKSLQRQLSEFYTSISRSSETAALAQRDLQRNLINSINSLSGFSAELRTIKTTAESFTSSLEKNKFSMREYFRYAAASTKTFGRLFASEFDTINKVAEDNVKRLQTQYIKLGRDSSGAMKAIAIMPTELNMQDLSTKTQIAAQRQAIFNKLIQQGSTNLLNFGKNTQWAGRQLMVGFTIPLSILGNTASKAFMEMETAAIKFKKVYGDLGTTPAESQAQLETIQELAKGFTKYGVAASQTVQLAADAAAAGFKGVDLQRQTTEATRLSVLGQVDQQKALETTIALQNAFKMSSEDLASTIDFLNAVENQTVTSLDDITTAIPKAGPVVEQLGGNVKDLAFFLTAMKEGGINASEGANALKSGLAAIINPTKKASDMLAGMGINIKNIVEKNRGNLKATVLEFAGALNQLAPLERAKAIEQMFGKFQFARLSTLFQNVTRDGTQAARVLDLAGASVEDLANLSQQELGITADSPMMQFKKAVEDLKISLIPLGKTFLESATPIVKFIGDILDKFNNLGDGTKKVITVLTVTIGAIGPVALMAFGLIANAIANGIKFIDKLRLGYLRLTGQSKILGEQSQFLTVEQQNAAAVAHSLDQSHAKLIQTFNIEREALQQLASAYGRAATAASNLLLANPGLLLPGRKPKKYADGVSIVPGTGSTDSVPAMLTPGEAVIPKAMTKKYGSLINGMIADNIPGYKDGVRSMYGGQERILAPYTMFAPGNTPGGFGMSQEFLQGTGFSQSMRNTAIASGAIEANMRLTDKAIMEMAHEVTPYTDQITEQLRLAAKEMADSGTAATHISQLFERKQTEINAILSKLSSQGATGAGMAEGLRKTFYPTDEDIRSGGNVRVPGVDIDEQGNIVRAAPRSLRGRIAARFQRGVQRVTSLLPIDSSEKLTRAHVVPESRVLPGGIRPVAGGALSLPLETQMAGRTELARRSAILSEKLGRSDAFAYEKGQKDSGLQDIYVQSRKRQSPHPLAGKDGTDDGNAYETARQNAVRRRRGASSPGGTVGPGGVIIPPMPPVGGGGGGGPTFLGMPGMPPKPNIITDPNILRQAYRENRFRQIKGIASNPRVGMAASTAFMAASMMPGPVGDFAQKASPAVFGLQALQMAFKLPIPHIKVFTGVLLAGIGIVKLVNAAREKERQKLEAFSDVLTTTTDQAKFLGDYFNFQPIKGSLENFSKNLEVTSTKVRTAREKLKESEGFQKTFGTTIKQVRGMSDEKAATALKFKGIELLSQGMAADQVQLVIDSIKEEAGKKDLKFDFKSMKFDEKGLKDLDKNISTSLKDFGDTYKKGLEKVFQYQAVGTGRSASIALVQALVPNKEAKAALKDAATLVSSYSKSLNRLVETGKINADQFNRATESMFASIGKAVPDSRIQLELFNAVLKQIDPALGKVTAGVTNLKDKQLLLKAAIAGVSTELITNLAIAIKTAEGLQKVADAANANGKIDVGAIAAAAMANNRVKGLRIDIQQAIKDAIALKQAMEKALGGGGGGGTPEIKASFLDSTVEKLRNAYFANQNFTKGFTASYNAIKAMIGKPLNITQGLTEQLKGAGAGEELITLILGMSPEEWKLYKDKIFKINSKTGKTELTEWAKGLNQIFSQIDFDAIITKNTDVLKTFNNQRTVIKQLQDQGMTYGEALKYIENISPEALAALASTNPANEAWKQLKASIDAVNDALASTPEGAAKKIMDLADEAISYIDAQAAVIQDQANFGTLINPATGQTINLTQDQKDIDAAQAKVDAQQSIVRGIQDEIDAKQKLIDQNNHLISTYQHQIDLIEEQAKGIQKQIDKYQEYVNINFDEPLQNLQTESGVLSNALAQIDHQEKAINEKYDAQQKAMEEMNRLNQESIQQGKTKMSIADALSKGDISAAAQAMQDLSAQQAAAQAGALQQGLDAARKGAIAGINIDGMTRKSIEERQYQIQQESFKLEQQKANYIKQFIIPLQLQLKDIEASKIPWQEKINSLNFANYGIEQQIYDIQVKKLEPAQNLLDKYEKSLDAAKKKKEEDEKIVAEIIKQLTYAGKTKDEYIAIKNEAELALKKLEANTNEIGKAKGFAEKLRDAILALNTTVVTTHVINTVYTSSGAPGPAPTPSPTPNSSQTPSPSPSPTSSSTPSPTPNSSSTPTPTSSSSSDYYPQYVAPRGALNAQYAFAFGGRVLRRAGGGIIPGSGLLDKVPALLTPGEFVMNKQATQAFGPLLSSLNQMQYPSMSNGGAKRSIQIMGSKGVTYTDNSSEVYTYNIDFNITQPDNPEAVAKEVLSKIRDLENRSIRRRAMLDS